MTKITISPKADIDAKGHTAMQVTGLKANVDLEPCTPIKIIADNAGNFRVAIATGTDACDGISAPKKTLAGQPVTIFGVGMRFHASDAGALTPGLYGLTANAREVDTAATGTKYFRAVSKTDLQVIRVG
ncbi:hypothetical protein [Deinococcus kurensis]|uniref:hypothetical protein n=1 Tax=Deinococcus kurensis TaxID=2662757 RepID=UPI0012D3226E|nr:hypothetical protein [Deinococcus kurensis]